MIRTFGLCFLISLAVMAQSQMAPKPAYPSLADFGLAYPLSNEWVRYTEMVRNRDESGNSPRNFDTLLAALYVPKSEMSTTSPFFTLRAYRAPATDCRKNLEAMIAHVQEQNQKAEGGVLEFSAADRSYFRVNLVPGPGGRRVCILCTAANGHLLVWNAGAPDDKGIDAIIATLNSITVLHPKVETATPQPTPGKEESTPGTANPTVPQKVRVSSAVMGRLLIRKVAPIYPSEARSAHIQGAVFLVAEINTTGDITNLELLQGPMELAGSAIAAVRQWKYRPYLLNGKPVDVETQVQVNYQLR